MIAYHIDRTGRLKGLKEIQLFTDITLNSHELDNKLYQLFPNGLSEHGNAYLPPYIKIDDKGNDITISPLAFNSIIENIFEYERILNFKHSFSRFESLFCCKTLDEVYLWLDIFKYHNPNLSSYSVYKVEFDEQNSQYLDSSLLQITYQSHLNFLYAKVNACKYWNGELSENPQMELLVKPPIRIRSVENI